MARHRPTDPETDSRQGTDSRAGQQDRWSDGPLAAARSSEGHREREQSDSGSGRDRMRTHCAPIGQEHRPHRAREPRTSGSVRETAAQVAHPPPLPAPFPRRAAGPHRIRALSTPEKSASPPPHCPPAPCSSSAASPRLQPGNRRKCGLPAARSGRAARTHLYASVGVSRFRPMKTIRLTEELLAQVDAQRGDVPRERYCRTLISEAIAQRAVAGIGTQVHAVADTPRVPSSAAARAGVKPIPKAGSR